MKHCYFLLLFFALCFGCHAEDWHLISEGEVVQTYEDVDLDIIPLKDCRVVTKQIKHVFKRGGYVVETIYYRKRQGVWEWAFKSSIAFRRDGGQRSSQVINDDKLNWVPRNKIGVESEKAFTMKAERLLGIR